MPKWSLSDRFDPQAVSIADRHYNRRKIGSPQFVPPGRCLVLKRQDAVWVTSWPFEQFTKHAWGGAWVNSCFRNESDQRSSDLIREAIALTMAKWTPPSLGIISFVDPTKVPGIQRRGWTVYGYCYLKAGFQHVGFTAGGLWAWQMLPASMPSPDYSLSGMLFQKAG